MMTSSNGNIFRVTGPFVRVIYRRSRLKYKNEAGNDAIWVY